MIQKADILELERLVTSLAVKAHMPAVKPARDLLLLSEMYLTNLEVNREVNRILWKHIDDNEAFE